MKKTITVTASEFQNFELTICNMAQRYVQIINSGQQPVLKNGSFVRYPVKGANADLLIFQDTSSVIEANRVVISSFEKNEKYAHHFCDNLVDIDA